MIDRKPLKRESCSGPRHQIAAVGSLTGLPAPSEACLIGRTDA